MFEQARNASFGGDSTWIGELRLAIARIGLGRGVLGLGGVLGGYLWRGHRAWDLLLTLATKFAELSVFCQLATAFDTIHRDCFTSFPFNLGDF